MKYYMTEQDKGVILIQV